MNSYRLTRQQTEVIDVLAEAATAESWSPDGLTFNDVLPLKGPSNAQLRRSTPAPTTWLAMDEDERASIRRRLRAVPTATSVRVATGQQPEQGTGSAAVA